MVASSRSILMWACREQRPVRAKFWGAHALGATALHYCPRITPIDANGIESQPAFFALIRVDSRANILWIAQRYSCNRFTDSHLRAHLLDLGCLLFELGSEQIHSFLLPCDRCCLSGHS